MSKGGYVQGCQFGHVTCSAGPHAWVTIGNSVWYLRHDRSAVAPTEALGSTVALSSPPKQICCCVVSSQAKPGLVTAKCASQVATLQVPRVC